MWRWNARWSSLPQKLALALLPELLDEQRIETAFAKILHLVGIGEAELISNLIGKLRAGTMVSAESVEELKYGTDFDPPNCHRMPLRETEVLKDWPLVGITTYWI
jgi:hypothetical protein